MSISKPPAPADIGAPSAPSLSDAPSAETVSLDALPCGVIAFDDDGAIVTANATLASMLGYDRDELARLRVETLLTIGARIFFQTHLYPMLRLQQRAEEFFVLLRRKDGAEVAVLANATRATTDARALTTCVMMEVRERRKFEDALLRAKQEAEEARAALEVRTHALEDANATLEEQAVELEVQQQQLQNQTAELEAQSDELQSANDILMAHGEELELARRSADEANRAKSQFLAVMSHELRTPLNAIGGYAQLLELGIHGPVTDAQRSALDRISGAQRHLLRLINEVLNLARIESGHVEYAREAVPITALVADVMPMLEPQLEAAGLLSRRDIAPDLIARADRDKVQQILINLLSNAVKFTPSGGTVVVSATDDGDRAHVYIRVIDSGIGIAAEKLERIFEPFVQVDAGRTRRREGTGLGLAISRDLARGMGGDLRAESVEGRGSTFTLELPRA